MGIVDQLLHGFAVARERRRSEAHLEATHVGAGVAGWGEGFGARVIRHAADGGGLDDDGQQHRDADLDAVVLSAASGLKEEGRGTGFFGAKAKAGLDALAGQHQGALAVAGEREARSVGSDDHGAGLAAVHDHTGLERVAHPHQARQRRQHHHGLLHHDLALARAKAIVGDGDGHQAIGGEVIGQGDGDGGQPLVIGDDVGGEEGRGLEVRSHPRTAVTAVAAGVALADIGLLLHEVNQRLGAAHREPALGMERLQEVRRLVVRQAQHGFIDGPDGDFGRDAHLLKVGDGQLERELLTGTLGAWAGVDGDVEALVRLFHH